MKVVLTILSFLISMVVAGQNLVKNPSFEEYSECPNALGTFAAQVNHWSTPTDGSTDYFNTCSKVMGAPENFNGVQHPKYGNAYAGVYFYAPADYREYIQVQLKRTLREGKEYTLAFYVSLAEGSDFAVKDFGVVLSYRPFQIKTRKQLSKGRLYQSKGNRFYTLEVGLPEIHEDKSVWVKVTTTFIAKGYEKFLVLGNLRDNKSTVKVQTKRKETKKGAYYYVDMVSITTQNGEPEMGIEDELEKDTLYTFNNIHFDFDKFHLTKEAEWELAKIHQQLLEYPDLKLEIHGHTDNLGTSAYNKDLSYKRAKTIADHFLEAGLDANRISWFGHGSEQSKGDNTSEEGRAINRRVEFLINDDR